MKYQRYSAYKDSGIEWLGDVPAHWDVSFVRRHFQAELGKMLDQAKQDGSGTRKPYLRAANIHWDRLKLDDINEMEFSDNQMERYRLQPGDLLVTEGGVTVGRSALWNGELVECYYQNSLNRVRALCDSPLSARYLLYWMDFTTNAGYVDLVADKATFGHLTNEKLKAFPLVAPSNKEETAAIVSFLDREATKIDSLIAKQERLIAVLQEKRQALISHVITKGLNSDVPMKDSGVGWSGEVPMHWEVKRLRTLAMVNPSKSEIANLPPDTQVSFFPMELISEYGELDLTQTRSMDSVYQGFTYFRENDVVTAKITPCFENGKGALARGLANGIAFGTTELHVLRSRDGCIPEFLWWVTRSEPFQKLGALEMKGAAGQQRVPQSFIENFAQPTPPVSEQQEISDFLDCETGLISELAAKADRAIELLQERRAALISAVVTGKIDVRNQMN